MALIECEECGSQISDKAAQCVNCGVPATSRNSSSELNVVHPDGGTHQSAHEASFRAGHMPHGVKWFERLMLISLGIGFLVVFPDMRNGSLAPFVPLVTIIITSLLVFWASRGRSNFAKWLNGIGAVLGTIMLIPMIQEAAFVTTQSEIGNPFFGNPLYGNDVGFFVFQALLQLSAMFFLFSNKNLYWFQKKH